MRPPPRPRPADALAAAQELEQAAGQAGAATEQVRRLAYQALAAHPVTLAKLEHRLAKRYNQKPQ